MTESETFVGFFEKKCIMQRVLNDFLGTRIYASSTLKSIYTRSHRYLFPNAWLRSILKRTTGFLPETKSLTKSTLAKVRNKIFPFCTSLISSLCRENTIEAFAKFFVGKIILEWINKRQKITKQTWLEPILCETSARFLLLKAYIIV